RFHQRVLDQVRVVKSRRHLTLAESADQEPNIGPQALQQLTQGLAVPLARPLQTRLLLRRAHPLPLYCRKLLRCDGKSWHRFQMPGGRAFGDWKSIPGWNVWRMELWFPPPAAAAAG